MPDGKKLYPLTIPGISTLSGGGAVSTIELRGWLRAIDPTCYAKDPAWYYLLAPDLAWADSVGISAADILRVGSITGLVDQVEAHSVYEVVGQPLIRIELGGWDTLKQKGPPPLGWQRRGAEGCPNAFFAFDPLQPVLTRPRLRPGQYVRVIGSLVSDAPHGSKAFVGAWLVRSLGIAMDPTHRIYAAQSIWSEGPEENPNNPARWVELHPPDLIEPLPDREGSETVRGVAICVDNNIFPRTTKPPALAFSPPGPRPKWARGVSVREILLSVSPSVAFDRAVAVSRVTIKESVASIMVDPRSVGVAKFAAVYRVSWSLRSSAWSVDRPRKAADNLASASSGLGATTQ
jgi:hypothetical protein